MHAQNEQHITLTQAAKIAPGRPSTNCMWRWCRRGVIARSGQRIKLEHIRIGGKLFTTPQWVNEFGRRLADADAQYFDRDDDAESGPMPTPPPRSTQRRARVSHAAPSNTDIERELEEAGL